MTITLKLDHQALQTLFPDGSDARVELQHHVIASFAKSALKTTVLSAEVKALVDKAKSEAVKEVIAELGMNFYSSGSSITLSDVMKSKFRDQARVAVQDLIGESVRDRISQASADVAASIKHDLPKFAERITKDEITRLVRERIDAVGKL